MDKGDQRRHDGREVCLCWRRNDHRGLEILLAKSFYLLLPTCTRYPRIDQIRNPNLNPITKVTRTIQTHFLRPMPRISSGASSAGRSWLSLLVVSLWILSASTASWALKCGTISNEFGIDLRDLKAPIRFEQIRDSPPTQTVYKGEKERGLDCHGDSNLI